MDWLRENFNRKAPFFLMGKSMVSGSDFPLNRSIESSMFSGIKLHRSPGNSVPWASELHEVNAENLREQIRLKYLGYLGYLGPRSCFKYLGNHQNSWFFQFFSWDLVGLIMMIMIPPYFLAFNMGM